jgi:nucleotide-binding universal stress UspA family protein
MSAPPLSHERVVVGVDGSEPSKQALLWARFLAQATGSTLHAVTAWQQDAGYGWSGPGRTAVPTDLDPAADATRLLKEALHKAYGEQAPPGLQASVGHGGAAKVLLEASQGARMLVVGSRGHGGFVGLLLGSVSAACAEHATCPVLVVHGATPPPPS